MTYVQVPGVIVWIVHASRPRRRYAETLTFQYLRMVTLFVHRVDADVVS